MEDVGRFTFIHNQLQDFNINEGIKDLNEDIESRNMIHQKLDELILLIQEAPLGGAELYELQEKFNKAMRETSDSISLQPYVKTPRNYSTDEETAAELEQLLVINQPDKKKIRKVKSYQLAGSVLRIIIALLLILLGFGMIIMPAPPYFEMFTLFYISQNDGVTIMDVISLIVAFTGIYLMIATISRIKK